MDAATLSTFLKQGLALVLLLSLPIVLTIAVVGLVVALLQAVTQVQESAIGFGIKLLAGVVVIALAAQWMGAELYNFVDAIFTVIARV
jgi:type III secretion protein S